MWLGPGVSLVPQCPGTGDVGTGLGEAGFGVAVGSRGVNPGTASGSGVSGVVPEVRIPNGPEWGLESAGRGLARLDALSRN